MGKVINISDYKAKKEIEQIEIKLYKDGIKITAMYGHINIKFCKENSELIRKMSPRIRACSLKNISDKEFKSVLLSDMNRIASQKENNYLSNMEFISKIILYKDIWKKISLQPSRM